MVQVNENYLKLKAGYLFPEIAKRVKIYSQADKSSNIIKLGIGDVTEPLPKACIDAMGKASFLFGTVIVKSEPSHIRTKLYFVSSSCPGISTKNRRVDQQLFIDLQL